MIPIFIRVVNQEILKQLKEGRLSEEDARLAYADYIKDKMKYSLRTLVGCVLFLISALIVLLVGDYLPNEGYVFLPLLIMLFVGLFLGIFSANGLMITNQYLGALKEGYPQIAQNEETR